MPHNPTMPWSQATLIWLLIHMWRLSSAWSPPGLFPVNYRQWRPLLKNSNATSFHSWIDMAFARVDAALGGITIWIARLETSLITILMILMALLLLHWQTMLLLHWQPLLPYHLWPWVPDLAMSLIIGAIGCHMILTQPMWALNNIHLPWSMRILWVTQTPHRRVPAGIALVESLVGMAAIPALLGMTSLHNTLHCHPAALTHGLMDAILAWHAGDMNGDPIAILTQRIWTSTLPLWLALQKIILTLWKIGISLCGCKGTVMTLIHIGLDILHLILAALILLTS